MSVYGKDVPIACLIQLLGGGEVARQGVCWYILLDICVVWSGVGDSNGLVLCGRANLTS